MSFLICVVAVCPIRAEASHRTEQVSQLLFGELCELLDRTKDFVKIRVVYDNYEGWCQENQLEEMPGNEAVSKSGKLAGEWVNEVMLNETVMRIPFGSSLPESNAVGKLKIDYNGAVMDAAKNIMNEELLRKLSFTF